MAASIALALWFGLGVEPGYVLGMSEHTLRDLLAHSGNPLLHVWWVIFIVILVNVMTTGLTLMTGGRAGLLVPSMILGGSMGAGVFYLLSTLGWTLGSPQLFIISGIASSLVAIIEVPLASIALVIEMFGLGYAAPVMVAVGVCHIISRNLRRYAKMASMS